MKFLRNSFVITLILLFILSTPIFSKKRNLSTPLSRLVGHWKYQGEIDWYFGPVDTSTMIGSWVYPFPKCDEKKVKESIDKLYDDLRNRIEDPNTKDALKELYRKQLNKYDEYLKKQLDTAKKYSGVLMHAQYKVTYQIPDGEKIEIKAISREDEPIFMADEPIIFYIDKNGKQMIMEVYNARDDEHPIIYIDSKTSPEDKN